MRTIKLLMAVCITAMTLNSCTKGDTGPAGPAGANGTSNMQHNTYIVTSGSWSNVGTDEYSFNTTLGVPTTDQVSVYWSTNGTAFFPMPSVNVFSTGDQLTYAYQSGSGLTLFFINTTNTAPSQTLYISVFVITPAAIKQHPGVNWNDYNQVKSISNL